MSFFLTFLGHQEGPPPPANDTTENAHSRCRDLNPLLVSLPEWTECAEALGGAGVRSRGPRLQGRRLSPCLSLFTYLEASGKESLKRNAEDMVFLKYFMMMIIVANTVCTLGRELF